MSNVKILSLTLLGACAAESPDFTSTTAASHTTCAATSLRTDLAWYGDNRETLDGWIASEGCNSAGFKHNKPPIALLDWDNTVVKNDVGDAVTFHVIKNDLVRQPPGQDWKVTSGFMTDAGAAALSAACGTDVPAGAKLPTSTNLGCADEMLSMYIDNKTRGGAVAFTGHNFRRIEPTYAWTAQLLAGNTHAEVSQIALDAVVPKLTAPQGTTQVVGTRTVNGWIRIYDQVQDLVDVLGTNGYDRWVITASPQDVVGALAPLTGIPSDHVIGIRSLTDSEGRLTYSFEGCGEVPDGNQTLISYIDGKRCWVNKVIFGEQDAKAFDRQPEHKRAMFSAGDSDTDISFMRDSKYKFVLNRNKTELMCFAYNNEGDTWRINPMFIQPRAAKTTPYACATKACIGEDGVGVPCLDDQGNVIPDQLDTVHP
ncbi:MAG: haloacid dehalogenase-like hydrolase [Deltaproteobacteria bacterium]|nr:haloacid dehalogenase-like hydrolase [Deltaproteobacteria bacterium]